MKSLIAERRNNVDRGSVIESTYQIPSTSRPLGLGIEATTVQPFDNVTVNDQLQNNHNDFNLQMVQATDETSDFTIDPSPSFDFNQDGFTWESFDSDDLDWWLLGSLPLESPEYHVRHSLLLDTPEGSKVQVAGTASGAPSTAALIERSWYTRLEASNSLHTNSSDSRPSGSTSPGNEGAPQTEINEGYRQSLSNRLRPKWPDEPLPSTEFLVRQYRRSFIIHTLLISYGQKLCIQLYFSRANPTFPILHGPTFRPTAYDGGLLLSICSIGCLFVGTSDAADYGSALFERLLRATMASVWVDPPGITKTKYH